MFYARVRGTLTAQLQATPWSADTAPAAAAVVAGVIWVTASKRR